MRRVSRRGHGPLPRNHATDGIRGTNWPPAVPFALRPFHGRNGITVANRCNLGTLSDLDCSFLTKG